MSMKKNEAAASEEETMAQKVLTHQVVSLLTYSFLKAV